MNKALLLVKFSFVSALFLIFSEEGKAQCPHTLPFTENFSTVPFGACNGANGGWTSTSVASGAGWYLPNTNYAGGTAPEAHGYGDQANGGVSETIRLISPSLNTTGISSVTLSFKHELYLTNSGASGSGTINVRVETSPDNSVWTQQYTAGYSATPSLQSVIAETRTVTVNGLTGNTLYFRFSVSGVLFKVWGWLIDDVNITGTVAPTPTISNFSPANACSGSGTSVVITGTNFTGASAVNFNGVAASSFTVNNATQITATLPSGATTGVITVVTAGGTATSSSSFTVNPTPTATATPSVQSSCSGATANISLSSNVGGTTYAWSRTAPGGISGTMPLNGTTNPGGTLINSTAGSVIVNFSITPTAGGCTGSATSANIVVEPVPSMPGSIAGADTVCSGSSNTYSVASVSGATSYTWTLPNGWSGTSTTTSINATAGGTGGTITVTANNACGSSSAQSKAVAISSAVPSVDSISGATGVCPGSTNSYSVTPVNGATSYTWTLPNGWSGSSVTQTISAVANSSGGSITVVANSNCGSSAPQTLTVNIISAPATPGTISGPAFVCSGSTNTYSVAGVNGATSYTWTLPNGWTGSSATETISATANSVAGNISVTANNACGSSAAQQMNVAIETAPATPGSISGANSICEGSADTYSVVAVNGATGYTWTLPAGWSGSSTTTSISTTTGAAGGSISVTANNNCGASAPQTLNVTVNPLPQVSFNFTQNPLCDKATPVTLTGSPSGGVFTGQGVSGSSFNPVAVSAGTYIITYDYSDGNGCSASDTAAITVTVCSGISAVDVSNMEVYPNPFSSELIVNLTNAPEKVKIVLCDVTGRNTRHFEISASSNRINTEFLPNGVYFVKVITEAETMLVKKVIRIE